MCVCVCAHILDSSDAVQSLFLQCQTVTLVADTQQVRIVTEVKVQLVVMAVSSYQIDHLTIVDAVQALSCLTCS